ncbi:helix-turn-helix transcriptional regulator [Micromonospora sp. WMMD882]|uniref:helix-turn-helix transcriptional regulator n=1 Tax=Micromonospora sp. WMMD882 TaxID=3015151 RepID=UPI00248CFB9F|nr:helix-turn-helix transcriptional regulator [Micromonospora sp. WMMD882]WBB78593.1 helix-turn-helix transcriptional regulator [Micromonospora sp. WMMD882]
MIDPQQLQETKQALGKRLRDLRKARGLRQKDVAEQVLSTRSTVANVEAGRQVVDRIFWQQCDALLQAGGQLTSGYDAYRRLEQQHHAERDEAARRARWGAAADTTPARDDRGSGLVALRQLLSSKGRPDPDPSLATVSLLEQAAGGVGQGLTLAAPRGQYFPGAAIDVEVYPAVDDGRILATIPRADAGRQWQRSLQRRLVAGRVSSPTGDGLFALDSRQASRRLVDIGDDARLLIPRVYRLDAITAAVLWAVANLDQALLLDDAPLEASRAAAARYSHLTRSAVSGDIAQDLDTVSRMWLGSAFCADHISRHSAELTEVPTYWTREQHGEEASTWLLFGHKLRYLEETAGRLANSAQHATRMFCVPPAAVSTSAEPERILLLLAVALMESFGINVAVTDEPEYSVLPGLVLTQRRAIVASWIRADGVWHVDVTDQRSTLAEYRDAVGHVRAHSVIDADTACRRLQAFADYLDLDWAWLRTRCAELGEHGLAGIAEPRSRLLSLDGVDRACRFVASLP